jgi:CRP-like cAMP-binding protein
LIRLTHEQVLAVLKRAHNPLEHLTANDWALIIDKSAPLEFKPGNALIEKGKQPRLLFLLVAGSARIEPEPKVKIAEIAAGEVCGEMSFLEGTLASASVIANENVEALGISWQSLQELFELYPHLASRFYRSLALNLSRRLRALIAAKAQVASK